MKILNIKFSKNHLFEKGIEVPFTTKDGVRKNNQYSEYFQSAFKIKIGLYSQVVMPVIGINATGKTSLLDLLSIVFEILLKDQKLNSPTIITILNKFRVGKNSPLSFEVIFLDDKNTLYKIKSTISKNENIENSFFYEDEILWSCPNSKIMNKDIKTSPFTISLERKSLKDNDFLKKDISILTTKNETSTQFYFDPLKDKTIGPHWFGKTYPEIVQILDPSVKELTIGVNEDKTNFESIISFKRDSINSKTEVGKLNELLSTGTIKGLNIVPSLVSVLHCGGYYFIDEIENHINRRIVEFIIGLFTDSRSNPKGACLLFTTHYPELLDDVPRKDNIFVTRRIENNALDVSRFSDFDIVTRNDVSKSKIFLASLVKGTAPNFTDILNAKNCVINKVNKHED